jgi:hypothetical protein
MKPCCLQKFNVGRYWTSPFAHECIYRIGFWGVWHAVTGVPKTLLVRGVRPGGTHTVRLHGCRMARAWFRDRVVA